MRNSRASVLGMFVVITAVIFSGCTSTRYTSTLKPSGDKALQMGDVRFSIVTPGGKPGTPDPFAERSLKLYPNLFTDDWTGVPVLVKIDVKTDSTAGTSAFLTGFFTLGLIPFPGSEKSMYDVETSLVNARGERVPAGKIPFEFDKVSWTTVSSPLGLLPVAGPSDLPRDSISILSADVGTFQKQISKTSDYINDCQIEAVVQALRTADQARLADDYRARKAYLQEVMIDGKPCWSFLDRVFSLKQDRVESYMALIYQDYPKRGVKPLDQVVVARTDGSGRWHPVTGYLHHTRTLTSVSSLMDGGVPARVAVRTIETPPMEDFIDTPDLTSEDGADVLRWSNSVLLEAKNRSMVKVLQEESGSELLGLATRIERSILDLNEQAEKAKDRAQAKVEKGKGDPAPDRELSVLCRQRMEILKPILAAVKQSAAGKQ